MARNIPALFSAAFLLAGALQLGPAEAVTLTGEFRASLTGIPVAVAEFKAVLGDDRYEVSGSGRTVGLSQLVTPGRARVESSGRVAGGTFRPAAYQHELVKEGERDRVRISFAGGRVDSVSVEPPPKRRRDRVPLADRHFRRVVDPLSAMMMLSNQTLGPEMCNRTLPIFDGEMRYDLQLSFKRTERVSGFSGPAHVCAIRYRPIAGHRPKRSGVKFLQSNEGMEIWMAAIGEGVVAPVKARVPTPYGPLVLSATRLSLD